MKGYAYLDKYGIMHASEYQDTAKKYAKYNGKVVETNLCDGTGYTDENDYNTMIYAAEKEFFTARVRPVSISFQKISLPRNSPRPMHCIRS